jgi:hypothetical protein
MFWLVATGAIVWLVLRQRRPPAKPNQNEEQSQHSKDTKK